MDILVFEEISDLIKKGIADRCDLNLSQTRILLYFDRTDNQEIIMGKLAEALEISLSTLSRQLKQKKTQPLIEVLRSNKDSSKLIKLSPEGCRKVRELKQSLKDLQDLVLKGLNDKESSDFLRHLLAIPAKLSD